ncbi:MAG: zinc ABC transporter substrate-binding protein [Desulfatiglandaceae bacterium]
MEKKIFLLCFIVLVLAVNPRAMAFGVEVRAFVSVAPQAYFVERVGGRFIEVEELVAPGRSPTTYEPTPKQIARLAEADVYFRIGVPFEHGFIDKLGGINPELKIVDTRKNVPLRFFNASAGGEAPDPHIWLDPKRVKIQAATICEALCGILDERCSDFRRNLDLFQQDLDEIDREISEILGPLRGRSFYVFHPAFGYFGDSYGLNQVAVEMEGKEPGPRQLSNLIEQAEKDGVYTMFVQPQFARGQAETFARAIGANVVPLDPLARDYLANLKLMAEALREALFK